MGERASGDHKQRKHVSLLWTITAKTMKRSSKNTMKRCGRIFLNDLNQGKAQELRAFLYLCHDVLQYFTDLFWQRGEMRAGFADLPTIHRAVNRFGITTRLAQALAKQAMEIVASQRKKPSKERTKPNLKRHVVTLFYHFLKIERFEGEEFDYAAVFIGSGAPRLTAPFNSTAPINKFLSDDWMLSKTIRVGMRRGRLWIELIFEKERPESKKTGRIVGMDSNYKNGLVFSDGQQVAQELHPKIRSFSKHQKNTRQEIKEALARAIKRIDLSKVSTVVIEDLKRVKHNKRGTFSRVHNRRLSHWMYSYAVDLLERRCEVEGVRMERKDPAYTSQHCPLCGRWERRNRRGDKFLCVHCGHSDHSDFKAAETLELLGLAGVYGLRSLPSLTRSNVQTIAKA
jgi:IS605 OrfB family transposase